MAGWPLFYTPYSWIILIPRFYSLDRFVQGPRLTGRCPDHQPIELLTECTRSEENFSESAAHIRPCHHATSISVWRPPIGYFRALPPVVLNLQEYRRSLTGAISFLDSVSSSF